MLLQFLLRQQHASKAIYLDNDLFFYNDYQFLFDLLEDHSFLLTPHYYKDYPDREQNWLEANFRVGLYNAGFVGVSAAALRSLDWWAACCAYRCQKNSFRGLFDDQKYLDLIPVREPSALVLRHQGCNVAGWNQELCVREKTNGQLLINGEFPIVFIHFNPMTIREILSGKDRLLQEHYKNYISALKLYRQDIDEWSLWRNTPTSDKIKYRIWKWFTDRGL